MNHTVLHYVGFMEGDGSWSYLGLPHEHQNPNAGIVWDEEEVYTSLGGPPNNWPREKTRPATTTAARTATPPSS